MVGPSIFLIFLIQFFLENKRYKNPFFSPPVLCVVVFPTDSSPALEFVCMFITTDISPRFGICMLHSYPKLLKVSTPFPPLLLRIPFGPGRLGSHRPSVSLSYLLPILIDWVGGWVVSLFSVFLLTVLFLGDLLP